MNWNKLQQTQRVLDEAILKEKPTMSAEERFNKTLVALSVEVAEVANCSEHFKFWKDNKGKVDRDRFEVMNPPDYMESKVETKYWDNKRSTWVTFEQVYKLTLIEECSDCLHFILSLANQIDYEIDKYYNELDFKQIEWNYLELQFQISILYGTVKEFDDSYKATMQVIINNFFQYVEKLGVTTQELEQAYYDKNKVNYERLREGY